MTHSVDLRHGHAVCDTFDQLRNADVDGKHTHGSERDELYLNLAVSVLGIVQLERLFGLVVDTDCPAQWHGLTFHQTIGSGKLQEIVVFFSSLGGHEEGFRPQLVVQ